MSTKFQVWVLHGPNLNLLGRREPEVYGSYQLEDIDQALERRAAEKGLQLRCLQSNHEGVLIDALHEAAAVGVDAVVLNAGGLTHTSVSLRDAVVAAGLPVIEVHLSNVSARESFRHVSLIAPVAAGQVTGFGMDSYLLALDGAIAILRARSD